MHLLSTRKFFNLMKKQVLTLIFVCFFSWSFAQLQMTKEQYIQKFKAIAISEMDRSGIPASITLAQGIIESRYGNSSLASEANNHFGIKCHKGWTGLSYYHKDDDHDSNGNLIESCFRKYTSPQQSFIDHSDFLMNRSRYAFIFDYDKTDYKNWAKGLKKAGYATNPKYADMLIKAVEDNNLQRFDKMSSEVIVYELPEKDEETGEIVQIEPKPLPVPTEVKKPKNTGKPLPIPEYGESRPAPKFPKRKDKIFINNDIRTVTANADDTPLSIAKENRISLKRILRYNDLNANEAFIPNQYVYLQPKRNKTRDKKLVHKVKYGESMYSISQLYGIKLSSLYKRNQLSLEANREPAVNENIYLRKKAPRAPKLMPKNFQPVPRQFQTPGIKTEEVKPEKPTPDPITNTKEPVTSIPVTPSAITTPTAKEEIIYHVEVPVSRPLVTAPETVGKSNNSNQTVKPQFDRVVDFPITRPQVTPIETRKEAVVTFNPDGEPAPVFTYHSDEPKPEEIIKPQSTRVVHKVIAGETLYGISRQYEIPVDDIKNKNQLDSNLIQPGQDLLIKE